MSQKQDYIAPTIKVIEFKVESGFAASLFSASSNNPNEDFLRFLDENQNPNYGATSFGQTLNGSDYGWQ